MATLSVKRILKHLGPASKAGDDQPQDAPTGSPLVQPAPGAGALPDRIAAAAPPGPPAPTPAPVAGPEAAATWHDPAATHENARFRADLRGAKAISDKAMQSGDVQDHRAAIMAIHQALGAYPDHLTRGILQQHQDHAAQGIQDILGRGGKPPSKEDPVSQAARIASAMTAQANTSNDPMDHAAAMLLNDRASTLFHIRGMSDPSAAHAAQSEAHRTAAGITEPAHATTARQADDASGFAWYSGKPVDHSAAAAFAERAAQTHQAAGEQHGASLYASSAHTHQQASAG